MSFRVGVSRPARRTPWIARSRCIPELLLRPKVNFYFMPGVTRPSTAPSARCDLSSRIEFLPELAERKGDRGGREGHRHAPIYISRGRIFSVVPPFLVPGENGLLVAMRYSDACRFRRRFEWLTQIPRRGSRRRVRRSRDHRIAIIIVRDEIERSSEKSSASRPPRLLRESDSRLPAIVSSHRAGSRHYRE